MREGDVITLDGRSGSIFTGAVGAVAEAPREYLAELANWRALATPRALERQV